MISIRGKKIFIENQEGIFETTNPELIGLAILDYANDGNELIHDIIDVDRKELIDGHHSIFEKNETKSQLKEKYIQYLKNNKMSFTTERKLLIDVVLEIDNFEAYDLINETFKSKTKIVPATCYNFLQTCVDSGIIEIQPKKYILKK